MATILKKYPHGNFAESVKYAIANYEGLQEILRRFNTWKYIIKNNPHKYRFGFENRSIIVYEKSPFKDWKWKNIDIINNIGSLRKTIGDWIN